MKRKLKLTNDDFKPSGEESKDLITPKETKPNIEANPKKEKKELTPETQRKILKLFEKYYFIGIVSARANIYRSQIESWKTASQAFSLAISHAQDTYLSYNMKLLDRYALNKRESDWRAIKYKLSIADQDFNDKKFIKEDISRGNIRSVNIIINSKDLTISKTEALKTIGSNQSKPEAVSLQLFKQPKKP